MTTEENFYTVLRDCRKRFVDKRPVGDVAETLVLLRQTEIEHGNVKPLLADVVNGCVMELIKLSAMSNNTSMDVLLPRYDSVVKRSVELMIRKNHDYDEAWRLMRPTSFTDFMLVKSYRIEQIERLGGYLLASEGTAANYEDILNYAVFYLIRLSEDK